MRRRPLADAALMGGSMEDLGFHERWLVVDAILKRPRPDLGDYGVQHCSKRRPATMTETETFRTERLVAPSWQWAQPGSLTSDVG